MLIISLNVFSQQLCGIGHQDRGTIFPLINVQLTSPINNGRPYWKFFAFKDCEYTFETCGLSTSDTELEILTFPGLIPLTYNDDACGLRSRIFWVAPYNGNYIIYLTRYGFYTCANLNSNVRVRYFSSCGNVLSVSLISFTGENVEDRNVLNWITESEDNNNYFTIERSIDGVYFENAGTVKALNTGTMYEFTDETFQDTINYYRLSQTDFNGVKKHIGDVISIDNRKAKVLVKIVDTLGREVGFDYQGVKILIFSDGSKEVNF